MRVLEELEHVATAGDARACDPVIRTAEWTGRSHPVGPPGATSTKGDLRR
ncbi:MAG: hypothetical protein M3304_01400 [Actinomycetota bacterium]|nr:hypothetical protein [Actinomycetota bacterium]